MIEIAPDVLSYFARSGGGGSSSSGGGDVIALIGYVPSYYAGKLVKKMLPRKAELVVSALTATAMSATLLWFAYLMHGGYFFMTLIVIGIWLGWWAAFFDAWDKIKAKSKKAKQDMSVAARTDEAWSESAIVTNALETFSRYQRDWQSGDIQSIRAYTTERYANHAALMLLALRELHRKNVMTEIEIMASEVVDIQDDFDNTKDRFQIAIKAKARDSLIDVSGGFDSPLFTDTSEFIEYWTFHRSDTRWLLDRIDQATADLTTQNRSIEAFAAAKGLYYSLDMGWLFLPRKGVLFSGGTFGKSDINNHTIGMFDDHLVQLYSYSPMPEFPVFIVAQINLPRSYEGIYVKYKASSFWTTGYAPKNPPSEYKQHKLEWEDFNKRYDVYATNPDRISLFELLNPAFMAYLYDTDPKVCIEVTDNIVYLYRQTGATKDKVGSLEYEKMFMILQKAYRELRM